jgi:hypothetical protein
MYRLIYQSALTLVQPNPLGYAMFHAKLLSFSFNNAFQLARFSNIHSVRMLSQHTHHTDTTLRLHTHHTDTTLRFACLQPTATVMLVTSQFQLECISVRRKSSTKLTRGYAYWLNPTWPKPARLPSSTCCLFYVFLVLRVVSPTCC